MNNVNEGWRSVRALMPLTGLALCASAFAADPTPAAAGAVATPDAAVAAAPESAPDATADNGAAPVRFLVMANQESPLSSVVAGRVSQVNVELGDTVKAGKLLVTLDCSELKARRDAADAEYSAAQIKYEAKELSEALNYGIIKHSRPKVLRPVSRGRNSRGDSSMQRNLYGNEPDR